MEHTGCGLPKSRPPGLSAMGTSSLRFDSWSLAWREFLRALGPRSRTSRCIHIQQAWRRLRPKPQSVQLEGSVYCVDHCLENALSASLRRARLAPQLSPVPHRIPLGLLLLSREQITVAQLQAALEAQRAAARGRIGEWLQSLGFADEQQVTAALARQWSCPILRSNSSTVWREHAPQIPQALLEHFSMVPVDYVESTSTLHMAFGEGIDYTALYGIEQMLGCHTDVCMAVPSFIRTRLAELPDNRGDCEIVFERVADQAESCRIIRSYSVRLAASEIRFVPVGPYLWVRLRAPSRPSLDLLLRSPHRASA